jgi:lysophospholipase L1-like esterase
MRARRPLLTLLLLGGSLVVSVAVCEVAVRLGGLSPPVYRVGLAAAKSAYQVSDNPILGYEMKPSYRDDDHPDLNSSFPAINSDGQRDLERSVAKPAGTTRVIVLGDSVAVGVGLREIDDLISRQLEHVIGRRDVEVLNFAVMGYNTRGEVELLRTKGLRYAPDVVAVIFVDNDLMALNGDNRFCTATRPPFVDRLFVHSALFRLVSLRFDLFHTQLDVDREYLSKREAGALAAERGVRGPGAYGHVGDAIRLLAELGRAHGFRSLIAIWPQFTDDGIADSPILFEPDRPGRMAIETIAAENGVAAVRLSGAFGRDYAERTARGEPGLAGPRRLYTFDAMHPNPLGARVAAEGIRETLLVGPGLLDAVPVR